LVRCVALRCVVPVQHMGDRPPVSEPFAFVPRLYLVPLPGVAELRRSNDQGGAAAWRRGPALAPASGLGEAPAGARRPDALRPPLIIQAHPATQPGTPRAVFLGASLSRSRSPRLGRPFGVACGRLRRIPGRRSPGSLRLRGRRGRLTACQCSRWKVSIPSVGETFWTCSSPFAPSYLPVPPVMDPSYGAVEPKLTSAWAVICPPGNE